MLKKSRLLTRPTLAVTSPTRPEVAKPTSSPKDAPVPSKAAADESTGGFFSSLTGRLFVGIDNLGWALGEYVTFHLAGAGGPYVEDHGDQTDHHRTADRRPEPRDRESCDQV